MIYIKKNSPAPTIQQKILEIKQSEEWRKIAADDTKSMRDCFDRLPKDLIQVSLLKEQHYICAYCMSQLPDNPIELSQYTSIEHFAPLSKNKDTALNYSNFLLVCHGGEKSPGGRTRILCCDASKGNKDKLTLDPQSESLMSYIAYLKDGTIYFNNRSHPQYNDIYNDINFKLKLNGEITSNGVWICDTATHLKKNRSDAYKSVSGILDGLARKHKLTSRGIETYIQQTFADKYPAYAGVILFKLNQKKEALKRQGL